MSRLRSCKYCGRIHDEKLVCPQKDAVRIARSRRYKSGKHSTFRNTQAWQKKREEIKKRDSYLCQCCTRGLAGTIHKYNAEHLSVHHVIPIDEDDSKKLDSDNLITVCSVHHEMCEANEIDRATQLEIVAEQNNKYM